MTLVCFALLLSYLTELLLDSSEKPALLTEPVSNPLEHRHKLVELMFEEFQVPATYLATQPVLSVYSAGRYSAITLDIGEGVIQVLPIFESYTLPASHTRLDFAGMDLTNYLFKLVKEANVYSVLPPTSYGYEVAREIKEKFCVCSSIRNNSQKILKQSFELSDGSKISLGEERYLVPEALFRPSLIGSKSMGIHEAVMHSINQCDIDTRRDFYLNILVVGGSSQFLNTATRMSEEMQALIPPTMRSRVITTDSVPDCVWIGGSIVASLSTFQQMWISKEEFDEKGPVACLAKAEQLHFMNV